MRICDWSSDVCYSDLGGLFEQTKIARGRTSAADVELIALKQRGEWPAFLELAVKTRKNILISGATGSGKTTLSKALIQLIPSEERLLTIEDPRELLVPHLNAVHLLCSMDGTPKAQVAAKHLLNARLRIHTPALLFRQ